ncbi:hypothetical protein B0T16DRAFT_414397 [Cercophora newfieldiana]|uniref:Uncharacterized protein n=1 Tax=Cercophora newfieldiana TaxID=92897 RepID=A0AA39Y9A4_9PEZI|nr:hypothetical protein B0T16DRAFT_414397 [Cercophora newfieldiana]
MAPRQQKFTVVPDALGMQGLMSRPATGVSSKPPMTSKQAQKLYRESTRGPRLSKAEQRRLELQEQERIRKELEKDKQAAKARAAREKKKTKEQQAMEQKKKQGLPLVSVRPSQDTISRFLRRDTGKGAKRTSDSMDTIPEDKEGSVDKENQPPEKRQRLSQSAHRKETAEERSKKDGDTTEMDGKRYTPRTQLAEPLKPSIPKESPSRPIAGRLASPQLQRRPTASPVRQQQGAPKAMGRQGSSPMAQAKPSKATLDPPSLVPRNSSPLLPLARPSPAVPSQVDPRPKKPNQSVSLAPNTPATSPLGKRPVNLEQVKPSSLNPLAANLRVVPSSPAGKRSANPIPSLLHATSSTPRIPADPPQPLSANTAPGQPQPALPEPAEPPRARPSSARPPPSNEPRPPPLRTTSLPPANSGVQFPAKPSPAPHAGLGNPSAGCGEQEKSSTISPLPKNPRTPLARPTAVMASTITRATETNPRPATGPPNPVPRSNPSLAKSPAPKAGSVPRVPPPVPHVTRQQTMQSPGARAPAVVGCVEPPKTSVLSPARFATTPKTTPGPAFKRPHAPVSRSPLAGPPVKAVGGGTANRGPQKSKFLPKHPQFSMNPRGRGPNPGAPPTPTQLFIEAHIDEILPSPSQEAQELQEPISKGPTVPKFVPKKPAAPQHRPPVPQAKFLNVRVARVFPSGPKATSGSELLSFISTQDLCMSTQDVQDVEQRAGTPSGPKSNGLCSREAGTSTVASRPAVSSTMGPPTPRRPMERVEASVMGPPPTKRPTESGADMGRLLQLVENSKGGGASSVGGSDVTATQETDYGDFDLEDFLGLMGNGF